MVNYEYLILQDAEVAKLADALRSGRSGSNPVRVQVSSSALYWFAPNSDGIYQSFLY